MVLQRSSYDFKIGEPGKNRDGFTYGEKGGIKLGNALQEPSAKGRVDSIIVESLHHGAGRLLATDPYLYRDSVKGSVEDENEGSAADTRQFGFILPGGALTELDIDTLTIEGTPPSFLRAASFIDADGKLVFVYGQQVITVDPTTDTVAEVTALNLSDQSSDPDFDAYFYSGGFAFWGGQFILGIVDSNGVAQGSATYPAAEFFVDGTGTIPSGAITGEYMVSWIGSTSQALYWIQNRSGEAPRMFWTDRTDQQWGEFTETADPLTNFLFGPFFLEIPNQYISGMGVAGVYAVFASADRQIWGWDPSEVFTPLTQLKTTKADPTFGQNMPYVNDMMLLPHKDGMIRFDTRSMQEQDISPNVHQGTSPGFTDTIDREVRAVCSTPTGAALITKFGSTDYGIHLLETYQDGMFYSIGYQSIEMATPLGIIHTTSASEAHRLYAFGIDTGNYTIQRLDLNGPGAQKRAESMASSAVRLGRMTSRPPDVNTQALQIRGAHAGANDENYFTVYIEIDGTLTKAGRVTETGPWQIFLPKDITPGHRYGLLFEFTIGNPTGFQPFVALPVSLDYLYVPESSELGVDLTTIMFEVTGDFIDKLGGGGGESGWDLAMLTGAFEGKLMEIEFQDRNTEWLVLVIDASLEQIEQADGTQGAVYMNTMVCRRLK